jgi:peptide deformylase
MVKIGHPVLRSRARQVPRKAMGSPSLQVLVQEMIASMRRAKGVGLAANQIGVRSQIFVMECRGNVRYPKARHFPLQAYLNPRIVRYSRGRESDWEGCLSIPGYRGLVPRAKSVTFEAVTPQGRKVKRTLTGFEARVLQHEVDHLNGRFYVDRMPNLRAWAHLEEFNKRFLARIRE